MNTQELEEALQHRILNPKSSTQFSALFFSTEYQPEDFARKMNAPGNSSQLVDKQKNGLGIWKFSVNTLTGGYIYCIAYDNPATGEGGDRMGLKEDTEAWFARHHTSRKFVKGTILAAAGLAVALNVEIVNSVEQFVKATLPDWLPAWWFVKPSVIGAFIALGSWIQHNPSIPYVGARKK